MKKMMTTLLISAALAMTFVTSDALAKRMANGGNMGMQRSVTPAPTSPTSPTANKNTAQQQQHSTSTNASSAPNAAKSSWMGPLMAFAAGGLLAAMFMGDGFEGIGALDIIFLILIIAGAYLFLRRRVSNQQTAAATANNYQTRQMEPSSSSSSSITIGSLVKENTAFSPSISQYTIATPDWFDAEKFLLQAATWYVKLQAAWDNNDQHTLAALTTPTLFSELKSQLDSRTEASSTQVEEIHPEIIEFNKENDQIVLTLRYTGYVSESIGSFSHAIREYWHLVRIGDAAGEWKLAGIQQEQ